MASTTVTTAAAVLKEYYSNQRVMELSYKDAPLFAMLKKIKDFEGASYPLPMRVVNPMGRSATFATAQANKTASNYKAFSLTRAKDYQLASIETEAILASESNPGAFLKLATAEIDGAIENLKRSLAWSLYGNGSGSMGLTAAAYTSGTTITLATTEDIVKFEVGQVLNAYSAESGGSIRTYDGSLSDMTVTGVDRDAGTVTVNTTFTGSSTVAQSDHIFVKGDRGSKLSGLLAWVPASAPGATAFFGVDRTVDVSRLAGSRLSGAGLPIDEALINMARRLGREGGSPDTVFLSFTRYAALEKTLASRVQYVDTEVAGIAFRGIKISGPKGAITVYPDQDCPSAYGWMLNMDSWGFYSLKEPVQILNQDGNQMLRETSADACEIRIASYSQLGCSKPVGNGIITF